MPTPPATNRFRKLIDDISRLYLNARRIQIQFAWETGRRMVEEEQNGAMRAEYGSSLLAQASNVLTKKYGAGFSESNLRKMRHFYLLNPKQPLLFLRFIIPAIISIGIATFMTFLIEKPVIKYMRAKYWEWQGRRYNRC